ncbi:MAG: 1-acyl-sn-glycerol-3-phosphate acyltransferase [Balneolaceae bacterium]|nr:1-acyl-sn-glycerol-3-phosphate acyltransferase [Balneolaceae bacterium]
MQSVTSVLIWSGVIVLILIWLPLLAIVKLFDRDPVRYKTGKLFRRLGYFLSRVNPNWNVHIEGHEYIDDRTPYVVVSNHLSNADIPVISNLPWELKWVAKKELFQIPIVGWMMRLAGDIPVDRAASVSKVGTFKKCRFYLERNVSVMFFPEGTRSRSGKLNRFATGAFDLAIREKIPVLPLVLDGTQGCLPKNSWKFEPDVYVKLKVLDPIETAHLEKEDSRELMETVRNSIAQQLAEWRGESLDEVDAMRRSRPQDDAV